MNNLRRLAIAGVGFAALAVAQDSQPQHITVPFRDAAAPRKLEVNLGMANITVRGTDRADASIDYTMRGLAGGRRASEPPPANMHRIGGSGMLDVAQDNNVVRVSGGGFFSGPGDVTILVPIQTSVTIAATLGGKILVDNIGGEIEINDLNGEITIANASGPVVAHSTNGKIVASLTRLAAGKSMSFSTFNGDVDVTLPSDAKATLKAIADNGDIFTDFDVKIEPRSVTPPLPPAPPAAPAPPAPPAPPVPPSASTGARSKAKADRDAAAAARKVASKERKFAGGRGDGYVEGTINGGGTEIQFTTFNGRILIHKK